MDPDIDPQLLDDPLFKELMAEGLAIQNRFSAEPVYAKTGKGYLKSAGVEELQKIKMLSQAIEIGVKDLDEGRSINFENHEDLRQHLDAKFAKLT